MNSRSHCMSEKKRMAYLHALSLCYKCVASQQIYAQQITCSSVSLKIRSYTQSAERNLLCHVLVRRRQHIPCGYGTSSS
ncbi:hypothetical protein FWK35_00014462 [Aphis craccivora]|uniref:Uncharacterized protein n=1 Tax=Aphis craccivora TaxID=307492 RepID=A0A6G0YT56_APHCR|nr:hypothetical protein FWK35_00014462 [Aphis craccivora]